MAITGRRERITSLRSHHRIAVYKPADDGIEPCEALIERDRAPRTFVVDRLAEGWTPEQISGWLKGGTNVVCGP